MVFGKAAFLGFLIISLRVLADVCCDDYECNLFLEASNCTSHYCIWENGACRDQVCSDLTSSDCLSSYRCKPSGSTCVQAISCSDWTDQGSSTCNSRQDYNSNARCFYSGSACREATCADYDTSITCQNAYSVGGNNKRCRWNSNVCVQINSCSDFNGDAMQCVSRTVGGTTCFYEGDQCKGASSCADFNENTFPSCSLMGCTFSGGACQWPKCSDFVSDVLCNSGYNATSFDNTQRCHWFNSACHIAVCSDYSDSSSLCESNPSYLDCQYVDNACVPKDCGRYTTASSCFSESGCYYLSSCPVYDNGAASGIFVPALLVVLLLVLFW